MNFTSKQYQSKRIANVVKLAGPRYEKEVNIELPVRSLFHALMKSDKFRDEIIRMRHKLGNAAQYVGGEPFYAVAGDLYDQLKVDKAYILNRLNKMARDKAEHGVREQSIIQSLNGLRDLVHELISKLEQLEQDKKNEIDPQSHTSVKSEVNYLYELVQESYADISFFESTDLSVFNAKSLLLKGEAGIGKTHLFCDFAKEAYEMGHPVYIFLGEEFVHDTNPLMRISTLLNGGTDYNSTFEKINVIAAKINKRAIILIDAINEAQIKIEWDKLNELKKYKNISFAISIRTGYESVILPIEFLNGLKSYTHPGLSIGRIEDISSFFTHFKVPVPEIPLIAPEFRNPLFIKIFCKTYARKKTIRGKTGSTTLFEDYVRKQTRHIRKSANLPGAAQIWDPLIKPIAEWMGENGTDRILENKAKEIVERVFPGKSSVILVEMQRHWLLTRTPHYTKSGSVRGYEFRFPYQRFSDHLIVRYLINHHLVDKSNPEQFFLPSKPLGKIINSNSHYYNPHYGLVEALAIQIPEHLKGRELADIAPKKFKQSQDAAQTFLNSLLWRSVEMKDEEHKYFRESDVLRLVNYYMQSPVLSDGFDRVLETILNTACIENHPLDASVLHGYLSRFTMSNRDAFWQRFVHYNYGEDGSVVERYLLWASSPLARKLKSKSSIELTATVLSWFLASSDRRVRDKSTKALVNLLDGKYSVIIKLLQRFNDIDDVYIIERLYAVAYGCALREPNLQKIKVLAKYIYDTEFANNIPKVHILIRDYARGVVDLYHQHDPSISFEKKLYLPPYMSRFPLRHPSEKTLDKKYPYDGDAEESYGSIRFSAQAGSGDFGRYVVESNLHRFSACRLDGTTPPSEKDKLENLLKSLTPDQRKLVEKLRGSLGPLIAQIRRRPSGLPKYLDGIDVEKIDRERNKNWQLLRESIDNLTSQQMGLLKKHVDGKHLDDNRLFNAHRASRWIFQRAVKLGWNPKFHGEFDRNLNRYSYGREPNKPERIGKKYQWQAFHEYAAMTADHYQLSEDEGSIYEGPWQLSVRDIDPSCMISKIAASEDDLSWWSSIEYESWRPELPDRQWIAIDNDLPDFKELIKCKDHKGKSWVNLHNYFGSKQRIFDVPKDQQYSRRHREIWSSLKSYIIKQSDLSAFMDWVKDKNFEGLWMPESHEFSGIFYREFPNQAAFKHLYLPYYGRSDWHEKTKDIPFDMIVPNDEYSKESGGYDMSIDTGFSINLPSKVIYSDMGLRPSTRDGSYKGSGRETIFFDPHIYQKGPPALLGSLAHLARYLESKKYILVWTILGEKQMIGGSMGGRDKNWPGRFEFSGSYYLDNESLEIEGGIHLKHFNTGP